ARIQRRAAKSLSNRKARVCRRLIACACENHEFIFDDFVNRQPSIVTRRANHFHQLPHSFSGAAASQRKCPDLLQLLASGFLHSRESNVVQNKPSASEISTFSDYFVPRPREAPDSKL